MPGLCREVGDCCRADWDTGELESMLWEWLGEGFTGLTMVCCSYPTWRKVASALLIVCYSMVLDIDIDIML